MALQVARSWPRRRPALIRDPGPRLRPRLHSSGLRYGGGPVPRQEQPEQKSDSWNQSSSYYKSSGQNYFLRNYRKWSETIVAVSRKNGGFLTLSATPRNGQFRNVHNTNEHWSFACFAVSQNEINESRQTPYIITKSCRICSCWSWVWIEGKHLVLRVHHVLPVVWGGKPQVPSLSLFPAQQLPLQHTLAVEMQTIKLAVPIK